MLKNLWIKVMENGQKFLDNLRVTLENLNNQNIANANKDNVESNTPTNGNDQIGNLIQGIQDNEKLDAMFNTNSNNVATPTSNDIPKTNEGLPLTVPSIAVPAKEEQTIVVKPSTTTNKNDLPPVKPFNGQISPEMIKQYSTQYGVNNPKVIEGIIRGANTVGTDPNILFKFAKAESQFNPTANAGTSSAQGLFQFLNKTWKYVMQDLGGKQNFNLIGNRNDPYENTVAAGIYLNEIKKVMAPIRKDGNFTLGELYLGHFAGPGTAKKVLQTIDKGNGNNSASTIFTQNQINSNKPVFIKKDGKVRTLSEVVQYLSSKVS